MSEDGCEDTIAYGIVGKKRREEGREESG